MADDKVKELKRELLRLISAVPASYSSWSWNKAIRFKQYVVESRKLVASRTATESQLISKINEYRTHE